MRRITSMLATYGAVVVPAIIAGAGFIDAVQPTGSTYELKVTGVAGVPADAAAVALNVTSAGATSPGYVTVWSCEGGRPNSSNLNFTPAAPAANSTIVEVGAGGRVCIYNGDGPTELIVDINGWFSAGSGFTPATPSRVLDTRRSNSTIDGRAAGGGVVAAGGEVQLPVTGRAGVPANASAVVLNLTADQPQGTGYVTAYPCGEGRPTASNLNFRAGSATANSAIVKVGTGGNVCLYVGDSGTQLIADVSGWFTGSGYTAASPARLLDTRRADSTVDGQSAGGGARGSNDTTPLQVTGRAGVPGNASAVVLNLTADQPAGTGYVTAYPCDQGRPNASNLNYGTGMAVAGSAIVKLDGNGRVCLFTGDTPTQLIADVNGWFTGGGYNPITPTRLLDTRSTPAPAGAAFVEAFTGNTGMNRFRTGVYHRNLAIGYESGHGGSWTGDHDLNCGTPDTQRALRSSANDTNVDEIIYTCKDHMMTSMGDIDGYSVLWFSPNQTFNGQDRVAWDVNVTNLGDRQWWEVAIIPAGAARVTAIDWLAGTAELPEYPRGSVVVGNGPFGGDIHVHANGSDRNPESGKICDVDREGCSSKAIRRTWSVTDNHDGTITVRFHDRSYTVAGSFPSGPFEVVFKDHNYTPDKEGRPAGHTWHWDNIIVD
jgi:hypothetical protein